MRSQLPSRLPFLTTNSSPGVVPRRIRTAARFDAWQAPGGGEIQMAATERYLRALGNDVRAWRPWEDDDLAAGDVVHFFGSRPEFVAPLEALRRRGVATVVSTIAWFDWRNTIREPGRAVKRLAACVRYAARAALPNLNSWRRRLYHSADLLLPNSQAEAEQLLRLFQVPAQRIRVVPNGVDERFAAARPEEFRERFGTEPFVLCPGRIEPRKNQLELVRALRGSGRRLVILGDAVPGQERYAAACRRAADDDTLFLGRLRHDDPLLASAYAACRAVVIPSWFETPSLAALEASLTGTPLVLPRGGCAREYFGSHAEYVGPGNLAALRAAVERAIEKPRSPELADLVSNTFTWRHVALATQEAYETV
ncbi:MAG: glycosyltransferase family 4 protein [Planctomycetaceae bacterium]|nr:glycosyltransferase family 4 protein [Planctomycetaceae bacterium]